jgi:hypothetical protein
LGREHHGREVPERGRQRFDQRCDQRDRIVIRPRRRLPQPEARTCACCPIMGRVDSHNRC